MAIVCHGCAQYFDTNGRFLLMRKDEDGKFVGSYQEFTNSNNILCPVCNGLKIKVQKYLEHSEGIDIIVVNIIARDMKYGAIVKIPEAKIENGYLIIDSEEFLSGQSLRKKLSEYKIAEI